MVSINEITENLPRLMVFFVFFIIFFSLFVSFKYGAEDYKKTRFGTFFSTLTSAVILLVSMNIIVTTVSFEYNQHFLRVNKTKEIVDKLWLYPQQLLKNSSNIRPEFLAGFYLNNLEMYHLAFSKDKKTPLTIQAIAEEQFIANVMIQAWEDCLITRKFDETPLSIWITGFLSWAHNPYFEHYYKIGKFGYKESTIKLADLLFEYAEKIPVPVTDPTVYDKISLQMQKDPRYIALERSL